MASETDKVIPEESSQEKSETVTEKQSEVLEVSDKALEGLVQEQGTDKVVNEDKEAVDDKETTEKMDISVEPANENPSETQEEALVLKVNDEDLANEKASETQEEALVLKVVDEAILEPESGEENTEKKDEATVEESKNKTSSVPEEPMEVESADVREGDGSDGNVKDGIENLEKSDNAELSEKDKLAKETDSSEKPSPIEEPLVSNEEPVIEKELAKESEEIPEKNPNEIENEKENGEKVKESEGILKESEDISKESEDNSKVSKVVASEETEKRTESETENAVSRPATPAPEAKENGADEPVGVKRSLDKSGASDEEQTDNGESSSESATQLKKRRIDPVDGEEEQEQPVAEKKTLKGFKFLKKFKTDFRNISQPELEEMILEKMVEVLLYKSTAAENAKKIAVHEQQSQVFKDKLTEVKKQFKTMEHIYKSALEKIEDHNKSGCTIQPVKVTRTVGIQTQSVNLVKCPSCSVRFDENSTSSDVGSEKRRAPEEKEKRLQSKAPASAANKTTTPQTTPVQATKTAPVTRNSLVSAPTTRSSSSAAGVTPEPKVPPLKIKRLNSDSSQKFTASPVQKESIVDLTEDEDVAQKTTTKVNSTPPVSSTRKSQTMVRSNPKPSPQQPIAKHPAPLPNLPSAAASGQKFAKKPPPIPNVKVVRSQAGIVLSWTMEMFLKHVHAEIREYQLFGYQETDSAPSTDNWKSLGSVKALKLPMAVTLTQFQQGQRYYFAVRARDIHNRYGNFSAAGTWP